MAMGRVVGRRIALLLHGSSYPATSSHAFSSIAPRALLSSTFSLDHNYVRDNFSQFSNNSGGLQWNAAKLGEGQRWFSTEPTHTDDKVTTEDSLGIATGLEREELKAKLEGKVLFDLEPPRGPFGTKDAPAIVESVFDERIVGCCGGPGEEEHDVIWFNLKKGESFECAVCTQYFQLKVVGPGGMPGAHHHH